MKLNLLLWLAGCAVLLRGETGSYAGSERCGKCHREEFERQRTSSHARALYAAREHPLSGSWIGQPGARTGSFRYQFDQQQGPRFTISDSKDVMVLPAEWAFGAGRQAITFVSRVNQDWFLEHSWSFYPALKQFGLTPGQSAIQPSSIQEAAGVLYKVDDPQRGIKGCFECHSTGAVSFAGDGTPHLQEAGVKCEACHGPGSAHAAAPASIRPAALRGLSGSPVNELCGRCHRPPASGDGKIDWSYSWNVRHQPVYLDQSRCFRMSKGRLSCLTCHSPHDGGEKSAAYYNRLCQGCHAQAVHPEAVQALGSNCVDCHMPRVSPQAGLRFTNHWIGTYRDGGKLRPIR